jgi:prophage antirepressor-like protein
MKTLYNIRKLVKNLEPHICGCCGKVHYSAKEACDLLGIDDLDQALRELDPDMKDEMVFGSDEDGWDLAESEKMDVVTLEGVFALVFHSQTSFSKILQRWIIEGFVEKVFFGKEESKQLELRPAEVVC